MTVDSNVIALSRIGYQVVSIEPTEPHHDDAECGWTLSIMGDDISTPSGVENDGEMFTAVTILEATEQALIWARERVPPPLCDQLSGRMALR